MHISSWTCKRVFPTYVELVWLDHRESSFASSLGRNTQLSKVTLFPVIGTVLPSRHQYNPQLVLSDFKSLANPVGIKYLNVVLICIFPTSGGEAFT